MPGQAHWLHSLVTTAPRRFRSTNSSTYSMEPKVPDAVITGFLESYPAIVVSCIHQISTSSASNTGPSVQILALCTVRMMIHFFGLYHAPGRHSDATGWLFQRDIGLHFLLFRIWIARSMGIGPHAKITSACNAFSSMAFMTLPLCQHCYPRWQYIRFPSRSSLRI